MTVSPTIVARAHEPNSYTFTGNQVGSRLIQGGMAGNCAQSYWLNRASHSLVNTRASAIPPCPRIHSRARAMCGVSGSSPASFSAKYASMLVLRFPAPP